MNEASVLALRILHPVVPESFQRYAAQGVFLERGPCPRTQTATALSVYGFGT